ncbi:MAG: AIR synthase-related protein, partial [Terriglobales bacterium]
IKRSVEAQEMYKTFNMGMGLAVICASSSAQNCIAVFNKHGFTARAVGRVTDKAEKMVINAHDHFGRNTVVELSG